MRNNTTNVIGAYISWVMDGYDLGAVVITSSILGQLFYPKQLALLAATLPIIFTIISRPLGGFLFGYIGDKLGRRASMLITVLGYSLSIGLTAFLPTYLQIGILASILLSVLRILQGIFIGGDVAGRFTISMESVVKRRGILSGLMQAGVLVGFVIVDSLFTYLASIYGKAFFTTYWRIIFGIGMIPALLAVLIRFKMSEPEMWLKVKGKNPLSGIMDVWQPLIVMIGFWMAIYAGPQFLPVLYGTVMKLNPAYYGQIILYMNVIGIPAMLLAGFLSDYVGRKLLGIIGSVIGIIGGALLYFHLPSTYLLADYTFLFGFLVNLASSISPAYLAERFKTFSRATGVGTAYNGAFIIAGWTQLIISLLSQSINVFIATFSIFAIGWIIAIVGLALGPETNNVNLEKI
ncbi:MFS transporter [Sulfolobus acidocaldarius]|uniref:MFS transporter n=1 Tax=Sulfolobus acidocaldarius TaxID=2285 RepID=UPI0007841EAE|nr:MFS transporter [Sulfolobus acidocaldarius]